MIDLRSRDEALRRDVTAEGGAVLSALRIESGFDSQSSVGLWRAAKNHSLFLGRLLIVLRFTYFVSKTCFFIHFLISTLRYFARAITRRPSIMF